LIGDFKNDEWRYKVDMVVIKFSNDMQHRSLFFGEGEEG